MRHKIDTETLRCSCHAPMCFNCGWCSAQCVCENKQQDQVERVRESDYDRLSQPRYMSQDGMDDYDREDA